MNRVVKDILKEVLKTKMIKVNNNGIIIATFQFDPGEMLSDVKKIYTFRDSVVEKVQRVTRLKYNTSMQIEPHYCYNLYVRSIATSQNNELQELKKCLKYFTGSVRTSLKRIAITLLPQSVEGWRELTSEILGNGPATN